MNDEELLRYFETHSRTERALFSRAHVVRIMRLAFGGTPDVSKWPAFIVVGEIAADYYIARARRRMNRSNLRVIQGGKR